MRKKTVLGSLIIAGAAASAAYWLLQSPVAPQPGSSASERPRAEYRAEGGTGDGRFASLPAREPIGKLKGLLFAGHSPTPAVPALAAAAPAGPVKPVVPYRVAGKVLHDGVEQVMLAKGDLMLPVRAGEMLDDGYRVESIGADEVVLLYVPLGSRERLAVISTLEFDAPLLGAAAAPAKSEPAARGAQLRWEGPEKVQAGNTFSVALKLTSSEPLRASPLQVAFDAKLLEPVGVRPGKFFSGDGYFSFRVNPEGQIFVGVSGSGNVPSDAELVVLTFRSIRPAPTAEVRLSSLLLQGNLGKVIAVGQLGAYRTAITP